MATPSRLLLAASLAAALALLTPNPGAAQYYRPVPWPGMGFYPVYPYPIGNFPAGTAFYPGLYPRYSYPYNPLYNALNTALQNAPNTTNNRAPSPPQPKTVEYGIKPAAPQEDPGQAKPAPGPSPSNAASSPRSTRSRPVVREYTIPKENQTPPPVDRPARIDVEVPARAVVYCDGTRTHQTGTLRQFVTPALSPGQPYTYDLRAEWKEGERTVSVSKRVTFHAGERVNVSFLDKPMTLEALPEPTTMPR